MNQQIKKLTYTALFTAIICILTYSVKIPVIADGYIHLGDAAIFIASVLCGGTAGAFAAGVGSALSDLFGGYSHWILPTLMIKGIMGFAVGYFTNHRKYVCVRNQLVMAGAGMFMVVGYYVARVFILQRSAAITALPSAGFNVIQFIVGIVIADFVLIALQKSGRRLPFSAIEKS